MDLMNLLYVLASFVLTFALMLWLIPFMTKLKYGQTIRSDGPETHLKKMGTPTMGGFGFIIGTALSTLVGVVAFGATIDNVIVICSMVLFGVIGFIDDYQKVIKKSPDGISAKQKLMLQTLFGILLIVSVMISKGTAIYIPFTSDYYLDLGWFYAPFVWIVILGTTNGTNLTDGVDALATSVTIVVAIYFTVAEVVAFDQSMVPVSLALLGGLIAFWWFNKHPAKIFMGDTGSIALGGYVVAIALLEQNPLIIVLIGFIYLVENISVILQVGYYKKTKKRIFLMAPLHHHYEKKGMTEVQVVIMFTAVTVVMGLVAYFAVI